MTWVYLAVLAGTVFSALAFRQDLFSPVRAYIAIYSLLLAINSLNLSSIQVPWCTSTRIFFWGASFMFVGGAILMGLAGKAKFPAWRLDFGKVKRALSEDAARMDWTWFRKVWIGCIVIFFVSYAISYLKIGQIPVFSKTPEDTRLAFSAASMPTYFGLFFGPFSLMLAVEMILFGGYKGLKLKAIYAAFALVFLFYMTIITRFDIFRFVIYLVVLYHYGKKNLKFSQLVIVVFAILVVFFSASLIRISQDAMGTLNETIKVKLPRNIAWASGFYAYLANDFWNMNYAFEKFVEGNHIHPHSMGMGMLRAFTVYLLQIESGLIATFGYDTVMNSMVQRVQGLNTVVYVWHLWKDFGPVGVFLIPLGGGMLLAKFHMNSLIKPTLFRMSMWGCLVAIVILSFHFPIWELWFFHVNLLVLALAHGKLTLLGGRKIPIKSPINSPLPAAPVSGPDP